ncbi:hypothetical protein ACFQDM_13520, partial [Ponticaulis profundi]
MSKIITVGLDLAKNVFQVHGADGAGRAVLRKKLRRAQVLESSPASGQSVVVPARAAGPNRRKSTRGILAAQTLERVPGKLGGVCQP